MHNLIDKCLKKIDKTRQESCYVQDRSCQILVKYLHDSFKSVKIVLARSCMILFKSVKIVLARSCKILGAISGVLTL